MREGLAARISSQPDMTICGEAASVDEALAQVPAAAPDLVIVDIQLADLVERLKDRRITLELTDAAKTQIAAAGYDPVYGARPLKRAIQKEVLNPLAMRVLDGTIHDGSHVVADYADGNFVFKSE